jgi:hypothetical protein
MRHYETEKWADFARGVLDDKARADMEAHLAAGCARCRRKAELLGELMAVSQSDVEFEPPASVLRMANAIYQRPERPAERLVRVLARIVYDSLKDPLPAGVRSGDRPSQVLYEAGEFVIDVQVNRERPGREHAAPRMVVVGQIANRERPAERLADVPVVLVSGGQIAASGLSNRLGEFNLEFDPGTDARLEIPIDGGRTIEAPLPAVA